MPNVEGLPAEWFSQFDGERLEEKLTVSAVLATVDGDGRPHLTFLSAGELLVKGDRVALALWPSSASSTNLRRESPISVYAVACGAVWEVHLKRVADASSPASPLSVFELRIVGQREHTAPYASATQMISFDLKNPGETLARWRNQIAALASILAIDAP